MHTFARRVVIAAAAGFLASAFALGALAFNERPDALTFWSMTDAPAVDVVDGIFVAVWSAGVNVTMAVLLCLLVSDAVRWLGRQLSFRRDVLLSVLRGVVLAVASALVVAVRWMAPVLRELTRVAMWVGAGGLAVCIYVIGLMSGVFAVGESTRLVSAVLTDPPALSAMALRMTAAAAVMYVGVGLLAACLWVPYKLVRIGIRAR